ncbi:hypothetical protein SLS64_009129 [Diaporthe eres]|uniref:Heterokaryon incompatibility domain-containing protein n=1 Tax=Diaporthe eres TaxID=83184 RepID=A0ABR1P0W3_DIAER
MPSRVLHISGTDKEPTIRLSTDHATEPYAALSYCWGADQPSKTTRAKLGSYLNDVDFSTLPSTIQDAAIVTRGIGLSYLWVDALCIVQDDFDDVMVQLAQMHAIYHCSWVTIAAAEALTCNQGFLQPRAQWQPIRMRARLDDKEPSDVLLVPEGRPWRSEAPLFQRGWTLQETLLSSRILLYGQRELIFLCLEAERCEGDVDSEVRRYQTLFDPGSNLFVHLDHPDNWGYLVSSYSQRLLAVESDKLLGIAALAENYGRTRAVGDYLAGLWRENFLEQCLWTTEPFPADGRVAKRPKEYRAPSWSWASLDARISSFGVSVNTPAMMMPETMGDNVTCQIIDVQTTLTSAGNPYGMVSGGYLVIKGRLRQVVKQVERGDRIALGRLVKGVKGDGVDSRMTFEFDCPQEWEGKVDVPLWSLEICNTDAGRGYAILLQEAEHQKGSFQRVGRLDIREGFNEPGNWFESEYEIREITII